MFDACSGIALAWSLFALTHAHEGYALPQQCLFEELRARTRVSWWDILAIIPVTRGDVRQLNLYARAMTRDRLKVHSSVLQTGLSAGFLAPEFDRYFVSIRSPFALPGWAAFKGSDVQQYLNKKSPNAADLVGVVEDNLVFYTPRNFLPRVLWRVHTLWSAIRSHWPLFVAESKMSRGLPSIKVRHVTIHRDGWRCVLRGHIYVGASIEITQDMIRRHRRVIIKEAVAAGKRGNSIFNVIRLLPVGFVYVSVFKTDFRKRRLVNYGLGDDLVCTIRISRILRIQSPDIGGSTIENIGRYRIAWNRSWMESRSRTRSEPDATG